VPGWTHSPCWSFSSRIPTKDPEIRAFHANYA
jgi:hypothetical protein